MAFASANAPAAKRGNFVLKVLSEIGNFMIRISESSERSRRVEELQNLSDAQLAKLGIKREDIVRHVFKDQLYI